MPDSDGRSPSLDHISVSGDDTVLGREALEKAVALTRVPEVGLKYKLQALALVLQYTKPKPAQQIEAKIGRAEDWLKEALVIEHKTPVTLEHFQKNGLAHEFIEKD